MSLFFTSFVSAAEEKCTWNIFKSNCKFQKISDKIGEKAIKGKDKIKSGVGKIGKSVTPKK